MEPAFLDMFKNRLRLEGVLTTRTGLHIGAGGSGDPLATDAPVVRNAAGVPFIPGASLKGVSRSAAESLLRGTGSDSTNELWTCEFLAGKPCVHHDEVKKLRDVHKERLQREKVERVDLEYRVNRATARDVWEKSCTVCRLFGSLALASRDRFPDLPLTGGMPRMELRNGVGIDRDKELAASGVLYDFEAVPPETSFELTVILDNAYDEEVGLILWLFDQLDQGNLALGGKTSRGLGQVRIAWNAIKEMRLEKDNPFAEMLSERDLLAAPPTAEPAEKSAEQVNLPTSGDPEIWKQLAEILVELPQIDKTELGQKASEKVIKKTELNETLALGVEGKRALQKAWDHVLTRFVECGFLNESNGVYSLATADADEKETSAAKPEEGPRLQAIKDRYVGAMARWWEEAR